MQREGLLRPSVKVRVEFLEDFPTRLFHIDLETRKDSGRHTVSLTQQTKQKMLSSDVRMVQRLGFFCREGQNAFYPGCVWDGEKNLPIRANADLFFDLLPDGLEVEAELLQYVDGDALTQPDQAKQ